MKFVSQLIDLLLESNLGLLGVDFHMFKLLLQSKILALEALNSLLLFFQRLSKLTAAMIEIFHAFGKLEVFLDQLSSELLNMALLLLSLLRQADCEFFHGRDLLLDLMNFILLLRLLHLCLTQLLCHLGCLFFMDDNLLLQKLPVHL